MTAVQPIAADEIAGMRTLSMPSTVLTVFNQLIVKNFTEKSATVYQKEVVALMVAAGLSRADIFANHWLDVEDVYRKVGWTVEYDKPGWNESYDAFFVFKQK